MDAAQFNLIIAPRIQRENRQNENRSEQTARESVADAFAQALRDQIKNRQAELNASSANAGTVPQQSASVSRRNDAGDIRKAAAAAADSRVAAQNALRARQADEQAAKLRADRNDQSAQAARKHAAKAADAKDAAKDNSSGDAKADEAEDSATKDTAAATDAKQQTDQSAKTATGKAEEDQQQGQNGQNQQQGQHQQQADTTGADAKATAAPAQAATAAEGSAVQESSAPAGTQVGNQAPTAPGQNIPGPDLPGQAAGQPQPGQVLPGQAAGQPGSAQSTDTQSATGQSITGQAPAAAQAAGGDQVVNPATLPTPQIGTAADNAAAGAGAPGSKAATTGSHNSGLPPLATDKSALASQTALPNISFSSAATPSADASPLAPPPAKGLPPTPAPAARDNVKIDAVRAPQAVLLANQQPQPAATTPATTGQSADAIGAATASSYGADDFGSFDSGVGGYSGLGTWQQPLTAGLNAARQADFAATLKQQLGNLPPQEQVNVHLQRAIRDGVDKISIQLSPEELGRVHVKMDIDDDRKVRATVTVERPTTLDLLQRDSRALERALQEAGLKTDSGSLSFNLQRGNTGDFNGSSDWGQGNGQQAGSAGQAKVAELTEKPTVKPAAEIDTANGLVDVEV